MLTVAEGSLPPPPGIGPCLTQALVGHAAAYPQLAVTTTDDWLADPDSVTADDFARALGGRFRPVDHISDAVEHLLAAGPGATVYVSTSPPNRERHLLRLHYDSGSGALVWIDGTRPPGPDGSRPPTHWTALSPEGVAAWRSRTGLPPPLGSPQVGLSDLSVLTVGPDGRPVPAHVGPPAPVVTPSPSAPTPGSTARDRLSLLLGVRAPAGSDPSPGRSPKGLRTTAELRGQQYDTSRYRMPLRPGRDPSIVPIRVGDRTLWAPRPVPGRDPLRDCALYLSGAIGQLGLGVPVDDAVVGTGPEELVARTAGSAWFPTGSSLDDAVAELRRRPGLRALGVDATRPDGTRHMWLLQRTGRQDATGRPEILVVDAPHLLRGGGAPIPAPTWEEADPVHRTGLRRLRLLPIGTTEAVTGLSGSLGSPSTSEALTDPEDGHAGMITDVPVPPPLGLPADQAAHPGETDDEDDE
jgi:hypothetical protein